MKKILLALFAILVAWPTLAGAESVCDEGDRHRGPNCIHLEVTPGFSKREPVGYSTVYRKADDGKTVLWDDEGFVAESWVGYLIIKRPGEKLKCNWNGKVYEPASKCTPLSK